MTTLDAIREGKEIPLTDDLKAIPRRPFGIIAIDPATGNDKTVAIEIDRKEYERSELLRKLRRGDAVFDVSYKSWGAPGPGQLEEMEHKIDQLNALVGSLLTLLIDKQVVTEQDATDFVLKFNKKDE